MKGCLQYCIMIGGKSEKVKCRKSFGEHQVFVAISTHKGNNTIFILTMELCELIVCNALPFKMFFIDTDL